MHTYVHFMTKRADGYQPVESHTAMFPLDGRKMLPNLVTEAHALKYSNMRIRPTWTEFKIMQGCSIGAKCLYDSAKQD